MSSSSDPKTPTDPKTETKSESNEPIKSNKEGEQQQHEEEEEGGGEEEEGECGFCLYMKGGGCKDAFIGWEDCIKDAEEKGLDIVEKCFDVTSKLRQCMEAHADYYEPILRAEKVAEEQAVMELEKQKETEKDVGSSVSS